MDVLYIYRRSTQEEFELRYSLRSVARHLPYVGKIWIFGDRPDFLADDRTIVEHVPQEYVAAVVTYRLPVANLFLQIFLGSLIPNLATEFLLFADDYFLLEIVPEREMRKDRALENLSSSLSLRERAGGRAAGPSSLSLREHCYVGIEETIKARGLSSTSDGRFFKSESDKVANDAQKLSLPYECSGLAIPVSGV